MSDFVVLGVNSRCEQRTGPVEHLDILRRLGDITFDIQSEAGRLWDIEPMYGVSMCALAQK